MASVGKKRRERWTITAENELREAVETRGGPDSNVDWEGVARDLETTVHRVVAGAGAGAGAGRSMVAAQPPCVCTPTCTDACPQALH